VESQSMKQDRLVAELLELCYGRWKFAGGLGQPLECGVGDLVVRHIMGDRKISIDRDNRGVVYVLSQEQADKMDEIRSRLAESNKMALLESFVDQARKGDWRR